MGVRTEAFGHLAATFVVMPLVGEAQNLLSSGFRTVCRYDLVLGTEGRRSLLSMWK